MHQKVDLDQYAFTGNITEYHNWKYMLKISAAKFVDYNINNPVLQPQSK